MLISQVIEMMTRHGARQIICKALSPNDNSKNQVYVAGSLDILNVLPMEEVREDDGKNGTSVLKAGLRFYWVSPEAAPELAPQAQLILYPQYPEVRLSGFLRGVKHAPNRIMASREPDRTLFLGVGTGGEIYAFAGSDPELAAAVRALPSEAHYGAFKSAMGGKAHEARERLLARLDAISKLGWLKAQKLSSDGSTGPCRGPNCGGLTLEAQFGISPNGRSEPDYEGWELKTHTVTDFDRSPTGHLTLMTPEPTTGVYRDDGAAQFVRKFGYVDPGIPDRLNFSSPHRINERNARTGLTLRLDGYADRRIENPSGSLVLLDDNERVAAGWPFAGLLSHWNRKHAQAAYVANMCRGKPEAEYLYSSSCRLGEGTDFARFLHAVSIGQIIYDPGIKLEGVFGDRPQLKRRNQFRIRSKDLGSLYASFRTIQTDD
jgi:hypothetical protein